MKNRPESYHAPAYALCGRLVTILVCCILALSALTARAADDAGARMVSSVTFVVNGSDIDASYGRNAESLDRIRCFLDSIARFVSGDNEY